MLYKGQGINPLKRILIGEVEIVIATNAIHDFYLSLLRYIIYNIYVCFQKVRLMFLKNTCVKEVMFIRKKTKRYFASNLLKKKNNYKVQMKFMRFSI